MKIVEVLKDSLLCRCYFLFFSFVFMAVDEFSLYLFFTFRWIG